jgi:hypothetical protein
MATTTTATTIDPYERLTALTGEPFRGLLLFFGLSAAQDRFTANHVPRFRFAATNQLAILTSDIIERGARSIRTGNEMGEFIFLLPGGQLSGYQEILYFSVGISALRSPAS